MPKDFLNCQKGGGKVVTEKLKGNRYRHICYDKKGKRYEGEIKVRRKKSKAFNKSKERFNQIKKSKALVSDLQRLKKHFDERSNG